MDKDEIQRLRDLPIESVAERLGLTVNYHKALCPFHADRHPSLSFYRSRNTYRCFVCGAHGGVIDLAMQLLNKNFPDACRWLGGNSELRQSGNSETRKDGNSETRNFGNSETRKSSEVSKCRSVEIPKCRSSEVSSFRSSEYGRFFEHPFLNDLAIDFLYTKRHLDARVIRWCRLNSYTDRHGIHWLQIPYYDIDGKLIGVQCRHLGNPTIRQFGNPKSRSSEVPRFRSSEVLRFRSSVRSPFPFPYGIKMSHLQSPCIALVKKRRTPLHCRRMLRLLVAPLSGT